MKAILLSLLFATVAQAEGLRWWVTDDAGYVSARAVQSWETGKPYPASVTLVLPATYQFPVDVIGQATNELDEVYDITSPVPQKHWKVSGQDVIAMTQPERDARDAEIAQAAIDADEADTNQRADFEQLPVDAQAVWYEMWRFNNQVRSILSIIKANQEAGSYDNPLPNFPQQDAAQYIETVIKPAIVWAKQ